MDKAASKVGGSEANRGFDSRFGSVLISTVGALAAAFPLLPWPREASLPLGTLPPHYFLSVSVGFVIPEG